LPRSEDDDDLDSEPGAVEMSELGVRLEKTELKQFKITNFVKKNNNKIK
jgi:hypothetical protein